MPPWNTAGASGFRIYMVFVSNGDDGPDTLVIESDAEQEKRELGILDGMRFDRYIVAHNWDEAMARHHEKMGLGPYTPFELD